MAYTRPIKNKFGDVYAYKMVISRGAEKSEISRVWRIPEGLSILTPQGAKKVQKALDKAVAQFENEYTAGNIKSRAEIKEEKRAEAIADLKNKSMAVALDEFLEFKTVSGSKRRNKDGEHKAIAPKTANNYSFMIERYLKPRLQKYRIKDCSTDILQSILDDIAKLGVSKTVVNSCYTILNQVFERARKSKVIHENPMLDIEKNIHSKAEPKEEEDKFFDEKEIRQILTALDTEPLKWRVAIRILLYGGLRVSELVGLEWKHISINPEKTIASIIVEQSAVYIPHKEIMPSKELKSKKSHRVVLIADKQTIIDIENYQEKQRKINQLAISYVFPHNDFLKEHINIKGKVAKYRVDINRPMNESSVNNKLKKIAKNNGFNFEIYPHKFRHTANSLMCAAGIPDTARCKMLGNDIAVNKKVYSHTFDFELVNAAEKINDVIAEIKKA